jgi:Concanavalin A-like lectin/glucanases superfamily
MKWLPRALLVCALVALAGVPQSARDSSAVLTDVAVGPNVEISAWTACGVNVYRDAVLATSPQAYLRMIGSGTSEASLGRVSSAWTWTLAPTLAPSALGCDANASASMSATRWVSSEHRVYVASDSAPFSYALWFKASAGTQGVLFSSAAGRISDGSNVRGDRALWITPTGRLAVAVSDGPSTRTITSPSAVTDGSWHFVVVTLQPNDSGTVRGTRLYLDGPQVAFGSAMRKGLPPTAKESWRAGPATLDTDVGTLAPASTFAGTIDEVAVWDVTLTDAQIATIWAARNG